MGSGGSAQTIGYKYYLGMHLVFCHGPVDSLYQIKVDSKVAWRGTSVGSQETIDSEGLFGGESREGGVSGTVDIEMGGSSQIANDYLQTQLTDVPGFRGVVGMVLRKCYLGMNPYLKRWSAILSRIHVRQNGLTQWYDAKAAIGSGNFLNQGTVDEGTRLSVDFVGGTINDSAMSPITPAYVGTVYGLLGDRFVVGPVSAETYIYWESSQLAFDPALGYHLTSIATLETGVVDFAFLARYFSEGVWHIGFDAVGQFDSPEGAFAQWRLRFWSDEFGSPHIYGPYFDFGEQVKVEVIRDPGTGATVHLLINDIEYHSYTTTFNTPGSSGRVDFGRDTTGTSSTHTLSNIAMVMGPTDTDAFIELLDMNPAHIIRECLTDPDWGMGYPEIDIDDTVFAEAADTLYDEGLGLSIIWDRQVAIEEFIKEIKKTINGELYVSRTTGKFVLKLIRDDYDVGTLDLFDESNIVKIDDFNRRGFEELYNSVTIKYTDSGTSRDASVEVQDIAQIQMQNAVIGTTAEYTGISNANVAGKIAARELKSVSTPLITCSFTTRGAIAQALNLGDAFLFSWSRFEVEEVVMRVGKISYGDGKDNSVKIQAVQDVFAMPAVTYVSTDPSAWTDVSVLPSPVAAQMAFEAPYYEFVQLVGQAVADSTLVSNPDAGFVGAAAIKPTGAISAVLETDSGTGYEQKGILQFCPSATIETDLTKTTVSVNLENAVSLSSVINGTHAQIDDELIVVVSIVGSVFTFERGALDTVPEEHSAGARIFFWDNFHGADTTEYNTSESIDLKVLPVAGQGQLALSDATAMNVVLAQRLFRPYPPGNFQIAGEYFPLTVTGSFDVTWSHRDRLQQTSGAIYSFLDSDIGPEDGVLYSIEIRDADSLELLSGSTGLADTIYSVDAFSSTFNMRVELWSVRSPSASIYAVSAFTVMREYPDTYGTAIKYRVILASGDYIDALLVYAISGSFYQLAKYTSTGELRKRIYYDISITQMSYDSSNDTVVVSHGDPGSVDDVVTLFNGEASLTETTDLVGPSGSGPAVDVVPSFSSPPASTEIISVVADGGYFYAVNYWKKDLHKYDSLTGSFVSSRVETNGFYSTLNIDASYLGCLVSGTIKLFSQSTLADYDSFAAPTNTHQLLLAGGKVALLVDATLTDDYSLQVRSTSGVLERTKDTPSYSSGASIGAGQLFDRYLAIGNIDATTPNVFDIQDDWKAVPSSSYALVESWQRQSWTCAYIGSSTRLAEDGSLRANEFGTNRETE